MLRKTRKRLGFLLLTTSLLVLPIPRAFPEEIKANPGYSFNTKGGDYTFGGGVRAENSLVKVETSLAINNFVGKVCMNYNVVEEGYGTEISLAYNSSVFQHLNLNVSGRTFLYPNIPLAGNIEATFSTKALPVNLSLYFQGIKNEKETGELVKLSSSVPVKISKESSLSFYGDATFQDNYYGSKKGFSDAKLGCSFSTKFAEKFNLECLINHKFPLNKEKFPDINKNWEARILGNIKF